MIQKRDPICGDGAALAGYLYDECEAGDRAAVSAHLAVCDRCTAELASLRSTRDTLAVWAPPEGVVGVRIEPEVTPAVVTGGRPGGRISSWLAPAWTQAAAAVLLFALGAGVAAVLNLDVRYDAAGVSVRTGWSERPAAPVAGVDTAALDERIRTIVRQVQGPAAPAGAVAGSAPGAATTDAVLRKVEQMLAASEERQQRELALRVSQVLHDVDSQHQADMARIERTVSPVAGLTAEEIQEQRQMLNYLMRVSQTK
ncbi:MAG: anti-sigma factor [Vicinamibacterales bacterium]